MFERERHSTIFLRIHPELEKMSGMKGFKSIENVEVNQRTSQRQIFTNFISWELRGHLYVH
jgi:hypothetical protein